MVSKGTLVHSSLSDAARRWGRSVVVLRSTEVAMAGYVTNIERDTLANRDYRRVLFTGQHLQLVLMTLKPGEEIGQEIHEEHDQFIRVEAGRGVVILETQRHELSDGVAVVIPAGIEHNV